MLSALYSCKMLSDVLFHLLLVTPLWDKDNIVTLCRWGNWDTEAIDLAQDHSSCVTGHCCSPKDLDQDLACVQVFSLHWTSSPFLGLQKLTSGYSSLHLPGSCLAHKNHQLGVYRILKVSCKCGWSMNFAGMELNGLSVLNKTTYEWALPHPSQTLQMLFLTPFLS